MPRFLASCAVLRNQLQEPVRIDTVAVKEPSQRALDRRPLLRHRRPPRWRSLWPEPDKALDLGRRDDHRRQSSHIALGCNGMRDRVCLLISAPKDTEVIHVDVYCYCTWFDQDSTSARLGFVQPD